MKRPEQSPVRRFFTSRLFLIIALITALGAAFGFSRVYYQDYKIRGEIRKLEDEVKNLQKKKLESMEILKYVTSQNFVEDKARTELNLKKPGEHVVFIQNEDQPKTTKETEPSSVDTSPLNNPLKWWYYFTKHSF